MVKNKDLVKAFGTDNHLEVCRVILEKGEMQASKPGSINLSFSTAPVSRSDLDREEWRHTAGHVKNCFAVKRSK